MSEHVISELWQREHLADVPAYGLVVTDSGREIKYVPEPRWVSCTGKGRKLPEKPGWYPVLKSGWDEVFFEPFYEGGWVFDELAEITHWAQLPALPWEVDQNGLR